MTANVRLIHSDHITPPGAIAQNRWNATTWVILLIGMVLLMGSTVMRVNASDSQSYIRVIRMTTIG